MNEIRVLIVDDEVRFATSLATRLRFRGFDVTTTASGSEALSVASKGAFEVALLDLKMPGMDGEEVLERLKASDSLLEVIVLTGHGSIDSAVRCTRAGSHSYLEKPCETDVLLEAIKDAMQRRVARQLQLDDERMEELVRTASGEGPLGILRRLQELEQGAR